MDRRSLLKAAGSAAGLAAVSAMVPAAEGAAAGKPRIAFKNEEFYKADGKFDEDKAKDAIIALCEYHGYPVFPGLREKLWIADYGRGQFTKVGLAAYMFVNEVEDRYMLMDIFLLPHQMLPEHWHIEGEGNPAKREGWLVRWGVSHIVGIGEPNLGKDVVIPKLHCDGTATTQHEVVATPGTFVKLAKVGTRHWQYAGPEGAIITEVANVHTNSAVRHSDPVLNKNFLGG
jgi:D-lyxose ketol-isomerase